MSILSETTVKKPIAIVVEDDQDIATLFAEAVEHAGFEVYTAYNNIQAYANLKSLAPQLVVLDLHLGGSNGADILKYIRGEQRLAATRVIVASADERSVKLVEDQADLGLVKPVSFTQLRDFASRFAPALPNLHAA